MSITERFRKIFDGEQKVSEQEQDVLENCYTWMRDDAELGLCRDVINTWACKISGIIEFLLACGKIDESQEEDLRMMVNEIESVTYE